MKSKFPMYCNASLEMLENAKMLRKNMTEAEDRLWQKIRKNKLGVKFRRQHMIDKFIADFYCYECKLVIEVDGGYHSNSEQIEYDTNRTYEIEDYGISVIRFTNSEVLSNIDWVVQEIKNKIGMTPN